MSTKLWTPAGPFAFSTQANTAVLDASTAGSIDDYVHVRTVEVGNSTGANAACGWGVRLPDAMWKAGQWDDSDTASYTDDTTDAQDAGTDDFLMNEATPANDDGFIVQAYDRFNVVSFKLNTAGAGGGIATPNYAYWNGSAWTAMTPVVTADYTSTSAIQCFAFLTPPTWTKLAAADAPVATDGLTANTYAIKVAWATAPTTEPQADYLSLVQLQDYVENVADGTSVTRELGDFKVPYRASIVPFCSVANAANWCSLEYRQGG